jgi:hypothetical protein
MLLTGSVHVWKEDGPEKGETQECHGEPVDVAAAILSAFDDDSPLTGIVISLTRAEEGLEVPTRESDPRRDD